MTEDLTFDYATFKYNILYRLNRMNRTRRSRIRLQVMKSTGISKTTYYDYVKLKKDDDRDMDVTTLRAFAKAMLIDMELLLND